ncbi:hypothetical protein IV38_GL000567 [Lactobacillus selangorensis]|uniref:Uncharacterized protein n=1 Tax=Lactobacillus selangorensis TaxID=81857 RepID=A0A0R2FME7_9LACO|nr:hypothetical protein [Lactobacillus selangorensis]KRN29680.1 hypothetical protein IV38_GL000567 [Lactobacillus selangorensis]KRN33791.1 hypothetical protein IV40_GL000101 [Lactobacillus selangorensis]
MLLNRRDLEAYAVQRHLKLAAPQPHADYSDLDAPSRHASAALAKADVPMPAPLPTVPKRPFTLPLSAGTPLEEPDDTFDAAPAVPSEPEELTAEVPDWTVINGDDEQLTDGTFGSPDAAFWNWFNHA